MSDVSPLQAAPTRRRDDISITLEGVGFLVLPGLSKGANPLGKRQKHPGLSDIFQPATPDISSSQQPGKLGVSQDGDLGKVGHPCPFVALNVEVEG